MGTEQVNRPKMQLDYGISGSVEERIIGRLAGAIEAVLIGEPAHLCMMALADVTARAFVEETSSRENQADAFSAFMAIVAKEMGAIRLRAARGGATS